VAFRVNLPAAVSIELAIFSLALLGLTSID
jgi:hypothetical protein